jgi:hypothetical protein
VKPSIACVDPATNHDTCSCTCTNGIKFDQPLDPFSSTGNGSSGPCLEDHSACQADKDLLMAQIKDLTDDKSTSRANKICLTESLPTRTPTITKVASPTPQPMFWTLSRKWQIKTSRWRNARSCARITSTLVSTMASIACVGTNSQTQRKRSLRPIVTVFAEVTNNRNVEETPGYRSTRSRLRTVPRLGWQWRRLTKSGSSLHRSSTSKEEQQGSSKLYLLKSYGRRSNLMFSILFIFL